jgi:hypothetical protein
MIGYYVHHQGRGHLQRALALAAELDEPVTGLSSLTRPPTWRGPWRDLPPDDGARDLRDVTANDQLHWVPLGDPGLRSRAAVVSEWITTTTPRLLIADVSVEMALLARLHGVPVVSVVLPGRRADHAHLLGFRASTGLVAMWPPHVCGMTPGLPSDVKDRITFVGAVSRLSPYDAAPLPPGRARRRVVVLQGLGGSSLTRRTSRELEQSTPGWEWVVVGAEADWVDDPGPLLRSADVVVTQAGQGSLADVAACRRPAVVIPAPRPHDEQVTTAAVLSHDQLPALVLPDFPDDGWDELLEQAAALDGGRWESWCDGRAARRFADVVVGAGSTVPAEERRPA